MGRRKEEEGFPGLSSSFFHRFGQELRHRLTSSVHPYDNESQGNVIIRKATESAPSLILPLML